MLSTICFLVQRTACLNSFKKPFGILPLSLNLRDVETRRSSSRGTQFPSLTYMLYTLISSLRSSLDWTCFSLQHPRPSLGACLGCVEGAQPQGRPCPTHILLSFPRFTFNVSCFSSLNFSLFICKMGTITRLTSPKGCCGGKMRCDVLRACNGAGAWQLFLSSSFLVSVVTETGLTFSQLHFT